MRVIQSCMDAIGVDAIKVSAKPGANRTDAKYEAAWLALDQRCDVILTFNHEELAFSVEAMLAIAKVIQKAGRGEA